LKTHLVLIKAQL